MKRFFELDQLYADRFENVWLWNEWPDRPGPDVGIDLVAEESEGGLCAIQCKFYKPGATISKPQLDSFIAASNRRHFTSRLLVNTGAELGPNARRMITRPAHHAAAALRRPRRPPLSLARSRAAGRAAD